MCHLQPNRAYTADGAPSLRESRVRACGRSGMRRIVIAASLSAIVPGATMAPPAFAQLAMSTIEDRSQAAQCLALAIAYEAGHESPEGQQAVAEVVLNRVRDPAFPKSVCAVVFAGAMQKTGCQFSFTCDGSLRRRMSDAVLRQAHMMAEQVLDGKLPPLVGDALNYHAAYVAPYWAPGMERVTRIGLHIFYRRRGGARLAQVASPAPAASVAAPPPVFAPWGLTPAGTGQQR